jgi:hypothetical protein
MSCYACVWSQCESGQEFNCRCDCHKPAPSDKLKEKRQEDKEKDNKK